MNSLLRFLIYALATWRVANLLVKEDGPSMVFFRLRHALGVRCLDGECKDRYADPPDSFLGTLFLCVWCMSIWVAGGFLAARRFARSAADLLATLCAYSAIACLIDRTGEK